MRRPLSSRSRLFYLLSLKTRQLLRYGDWLFGGKRFALELSEAKLPYRVYKHQSVLVRTLGDADLQLQYNKVINLRLALRHINGVLIRPGETFSFWRLVGCANKSKGYLEGMLLLNGEARSGVGGGLCQIANLIHWLALHSPLDVTEHHHHSYDPFPDSGRVVPFGSGATLFYNYLDYQLTNNTPHTFQLVFWMDAKCLNGDLRISEELPYKYHVLEKNHEFLQIGESFYRTNEIWRHKIRKIGSGEVLSTELVRKNFSLVKYVPQQYRAVPAEESGQYLSAT